VVGAAYFLSIYRRAFFGPAIRQAVIEAEDLRPREFWLALIFALLIVIFGFFPALLLDLMQPAAEAWLKRLG